MKEYILLSPEKVHLKLNLAGVGSRFAACFIDTIFQSLLMGFFILGAFLLYSAGITPEEPPVWWLMVIVLFAVFAVLNGYFIFFETIWNGQTPGKRFLKIRVVQENGSPVTFLKVLIRNILRLIDSLPTAYAIGVISALISKKNQRLGDMAAGTVVIRESVEDAPAAVNFEVDETPWSGAARLHIHKIGEDEFAVLKKYLLRRETLKQEEVQVMDQKLVLFFSRKLGLKPEETGNALAFLKQVAAMYQRR
ncbi:MAG: RDD family protein [Peptococcaceae bacterium]|nr:RDD family protein [Peptococcaceae bacterium]